MDTKVEEIVHKPPAHKTRKEQRSSVSSPRSAVHPVAGAASSKTKNSTAVPSKTPRRQPPRPIPNSNHRSDEAAESPASMTTCNSGDKRKRQNTKQVSVKETQPAGRSSEAQPATTQSSTTAKKRTGSHTGVHVSIGLSVPDRTNRGKTAGQMARQSISKPVNKVTPQKSQQIGKVSSEMNTTTPYKHRQLPPRRNEEPAIPEVGAPSPTTTRKAASSHVTTQLSSRPAAGPRKSNTSSQQNQLMKPLPTTPDNPITEKQLRLTPTKKVLGQRNPVGLANLGNTCYFNSVMQNINQTFLLQWLLEQATLNNHRQPITHSLKDFYGSLSHLSPSNNSVKSVCASLFRSIACRSSRFQGGRQQDSHELLRHMMDGVKEEEKDVNKQQFTKFSDDGQYRELTVVDKVFGGHYLTVFHCEKCHTPYHLFEPFLDVSLPVAYSDNEVYTMKPDEQDSNTDLMFEKGQTLQDQYKAAIKIIQKRLSVKQNQVEQDSVLASLRFFTRKEILVDEYFCLECNKGKEGYTLTTGTKQTIIYSPPAILTVHLKRFEHSPGGYKKVSRHIKFRTELDLSPYCSQLALRRLKLAEIRYKLYGIVVHGGSLHGGHYTACVKVRSVDVEQTRQFLQTKFIDRDVLMAKDELVKLVQETPSYLHVAAADSNDTANKWYEISDSSVSETPETTVLAMQAYLLFYERVS